MKNIILCFLLLGIPVVTIAQPSAKTLKAIDAYIEKVRTEWNVPAVAVSIVQDGKVVFARGFGYADVENQRVADENTLFAIGSSSKAFTALSVLQLVDDGLVDLDDPVLNYLPGLRMHDDYVTSHLTVRDLLSHRSGLPRHDLVWYGAPDTREELFSKLRYLEPSAGFREIFQYQNLMYMTAGYLVGQTRMSTWEAEVQSRIFDPLGMERSNFSVVKMQEDANHALPYKKEDEAVTKMEFRNIDAVGPAGSINSSVTEMANWAILQLNGGKFNEKEIISARNLAQSHASVIPVPAGWYTPLAADPSDGPTTYGLGWFISSHNGHRSVYHGGNIDGFSASVGLLPEENVGVVILTNLNGNPVPNILRNYIFDQMLNEEPHDWNADMHAFADNVKKQQEMQSGQDDLKRAKDTSPSHALSDYSGMYVNEAYGTFEIAADGDSLVVKFRDQQFKAGHYHYDVFEGKMPMLGAMKVAFNTDVEGQVYELTSSLEPQTSAIRFARKASVQPLSEEELQQFTGDYLIQGVQKVTVSVENESLVLIVPGQPKYTLEPNGNMKFNLKGMKGFSALFQKSTEGTVSAMVLLQPNGQFKGEKIVESQTVK